MPDNKTITFTTPLYEEVFSLLVEEETSWTKTIEVDLHDTAVQKISDELLGRKFLFMHTKSSRIAQTLPQLLKTKTKGFVRP